MKAKAEVEAAGSRSDSKVETVTEVEGNEVKVE